MIRSCNIIIESKGIYGQQDVKGVSVKLWAEQSLAERGSKGAKDTEHEHSYRKSQFPCSLDELGNTSECDQLDKSLKAKIQQTKHNRKPVNFDPESSITAVCGRGGAAPFSVMDKDGFTKLLDSSLDKLRQQLLEALSQNDFESLISDFNNSDWNDQTIFKIHVNSLDTLVPNFFLHLHRILEFLDSALLPLTFITLLGFSRRDCRDCCEFDELLEEPKGTPSVDDAPSTALAKLLNLSKDIKGSFCNCCTSCSSSGCWWRWWCVSTFLHFHHHRI